MPYPSRGQFPQPPSTTESTAQPPSNRKRKLPSDLQSAYDRVQLRSHRFLRSRDEIADEQQVLAAEQQCQVFSSNAVISCFPTANTSIPQHQIASFVWNSRLPQFTQTNLVNIYLVDAVSQTPIQSWLNEPNPIGRAGVVRFPVNDTWFGSRGANWNGQDTPYLFYWMITRSDALVEMGIPQPIFAAVQTTLADSVTSSMASASSAAAASSLSAASVASASAAASRSSALSASRASASQTSTSTSTSSPGSVQNDGSGSQFPRWAIAVIVVLGLLALIASGVLTFFIMRRVRRNRGASLSHRGSVGSSTPMMSNVHAQNTQSPLLGGAALASGVPGPQRPHSPEAHDGASTLSRISDQAPFSGADAVVMANAFRDMLRKPTFSDRSPDEAEILDERNAIQEALINRELAEEGRDIRSVSSSRGVKVETLDGDDDASSPVQDHHH